jgi:thioredoxin-related protein
MKKLLLALLLLAAPLLSQASAGPPEGWPFVSYEKGMPLAKQNNKPVFILFGLEPCPFCEHLNAHTFSDAKLRELYTQEYVLVYMEIKGLNEQSEHLLPDGTTISHRDFVRKHRAFVAPAWAYYDRNGVKVFQGAGSEESAENFRNFHKYVAGEHFRQATYNEFLSKQATQ